MADVRMIRAASPGDIEALRKLRGEYCRYVYKGFDVLCNEDDDQDFVDTVSQSLKDSCSRISLLYLNDALTAFCCYRLPDPSAGEILELQYAPSASISDIQELMDSVLKDMETHSASFVQVWVLRDNLRARFHYQQFGFKPLGGGRKTDAGDLSLSLTRYVYCFKGCLPDCI